MDSFRRLVPKWLISSRHSAKVAPKVESSSSISGTTTTEESIRYNKDGDGSLERGGSQGIGGGGAAEIDAPLSSGTDFTVDDAVQQLGFGHYQWLLSLLTGFAWAADAMEMMILAVLSPALHCEWQISTAQQAMITTAVFVGMAIGSPLWGKVCDRYGRRKGIALSTLLTFAVGALSALSPNYSIFLVLRGLMGVGIGGAPQSMTLYSEYLPYAHRARCLILIRLSWALGTLFTALLALLVMEAWGWRWLLVCSSLPCLLASASCVWLPESARFLVASGRHKEALHTLHRVARLNGRPMPQGRLVESTSAGVLQASEQRGYLSHLFNRELRATTVFLWVIWGVSAFAYYGIVLFTTVLFQSGDECHGGSGGGGVNPGGNHTVAVAVKTPTCRPLVQKDYMDIVSTTLAEFPGTLLTAWVIEVVGRKRTMASEFGIFAASILLLLFCLSRGWITAILFVARTIIGGAFQTSYVYTLEVYPTTVRAVGLGASSAWARVGAIVTPFVAQVAAAHSLRLPIVIYAVAALVAALAALGLPAGETKGRRQLPETHAGGETAAAAGTGRSIVK